MIVVREAAVVRRETARWRTESERIAFVPTMGYLHEGHLSLIDEARRRGATRVVVSIFVNPTQFAAGEDLDRYPRDEERDRRLLEAREVDLLFAPSAGEMYPAGFATTVHVGGVTGPLEGERRPGHFDGVATVVLKLLNIVQPDLAVFGQKDAQQCAVVRKLVRDLDVPVSLIFGDTVRESDGLAMSSRNAYLSPEQRGTAAALSRSLEAGMRVAEKGGSIDAVEDAMKDELSRYPGAELDYLAVIDPESFEKPADSAGEWLLAGAIRVGSTRLIDNMLMRRTAVTEERR